MIINGWLMDDWRIFAPSPPAPSGTSGGRSIPATPEVSPGRRCLEPTGFVASDFVTQKTWKNRRLGHCLVNKNMKKHGKMEKKYNSAWPTAVEFFWNFKQWPTFVLLQRSPFSQVAQRRTAILQAFIQKWWTSRPVIQYLGCCFC